MQISTALPNLRQMAAHPNRVVEEKLEQLDGFIRQLGTDHPGMQGSLKPTAEGFEMSVLARTTRPEPAPSGAPFMDETGLNVRLSGQTLTVHEVNGFYIGRPNEAGAISGHEASYQIDLTHGSMSDVRQCDIGCVHDWMKKDFGLDLARGPLPCLAMFGPWGGE